MAACVMGIFVCGVLTGHANHRWFLRIAEALDGMSASGMENTALRPLKGRGQIAR